MNTIYLCNNNKLDGLTIDDSFKNLSNDEIKKLATELCEKNFGFVIDNEELAWNIRKLLNDETKYKYTCYCREWGGIYIIRLMLPNDTKNKPVFYTNKYETLKHVDDILKCNDDVDYVNIDYYQTGPLIVFSDLINLPSSVIIIRFELDACHPYNENSLIDRWFQQETQTEIDKCRVIITNVLSKLTNLKLIIFEHGCDYNDLLEECIKNMNRYIEIECKYI
jgi:hypothetical protein